MNKGDSIVAYGKKPVREVLETHGNLVTQVLLKDTLEQGEGDEIIALCRKRKIPCNRVPEKKLDLFTGDDTNHQGVLALLRSFPYTELSTWLTEKKDNEHLSVILLDQIQDVHNLGAIVRSAAAFGIDAVIIGEHRQAPVTGAVFKTSAGAILRVPIIQVGNTNQALDTLKEHGFWSIGLASDGETDISAYEQDKRMVIIVGGEKSGMREKTRERCDTVVRIPIENVESLNASVASAIVCYERNLFLRNIQRKE